MDDRALTRALGAVIAEQRRAAGLTQAQLAELLGEGSLRNYKRIESGDIRCHPELLMQIAEHLSTHGWRLMKAAEERFESGRR